MDSGVSNEIEEDEEMYDSGLSEEEEVVDRRPRKNLARKRGKGSMANTRTKGTTGLRQHPARVQASVRSKKRAGLTAKVSKTRRDQRASRPPKSHRARRKAPQKCLRAHHDLASDSEEEV
ncbi:hypothetical protein FGB62_85g16 [Gracilaria domingensis]|nr:hypothetical protein FGB62_85g16 [Gracilaria domingensis]